MCVCVCYYDYSVRVYAIFVYIFVRYSYIYLYMPIVSLCVTTMSVCVCVILCVMIVLVKKYFCKWRRYVHVWRLCLLVHGCWCVSMCGSCVDVSIFLCACDNCLRHLPSSMFVCSKCYFCDWDLCVSVCVYTDVSSEWDV